MKKLIIYLISGCFLLSAGVSYASWEGSFASLKKDMESLRKQIFLLEDSSDKKNAEIKHLMVKIQRIGARLGQIRQSLQTDSKDSAVMKEKEVSGGDVPAGGVSFENSKNFSVAPLLSLLANMEKKLDILSRKSREQEYLKQEKEYRSQIIDLEKQVRKLRLELRARQETIVRLKRKKAAMRKQIQSGATEEKITSPDNGCREERRTCQERQRSLLSDYKKELGRRQISFLEEKKDLLSRIRELNNRILGLEKEKVNLSRDVDTYKVREESFQQKQKNKESESGNQYKALKEELRDLKKRNAFLEKQLRLLEKKGR